MGSLIIMGIVTAANFLILKIKAEQHRWADLIFDLITLSILSFLFSGTIKGLIIAMVSSFIISGYLYFYPPKIDKMLPKFFDKETKEKDLDACSV